MEEGKGKAEEALKAMRDAGLTIKVKKHSTKDSKKALGRSHTCGQGSKMSPTWAKKGRDGAMMGPR